VTPYYDDGVVTIYHGDCREVLEWLSANVLVTDPPYGIAYDSGRDGALPRSIDGDEDTSLRDWALERWGDRPALVFGTWRRPRPAATRMNLVWDTKGALGMGALDLPWKPAHQEVYVLGRGFTGRRTTDVLTYAPVQSMAANGRVHPHEKPVDLMRALIGKCPPGVVADPFCGSGPTLRAAKDLGRRAVGVETKERYCEMAARRMGQEVLAL
jgi:DNA modification methylase